MTDVRKALDPAVLEHLQERLTRLRGSLVEAEHHQAEWLEGIPPEHCVSARNLLHYVALRRYDVRDLQARLAQVGLSSLGRSEPHVLVSLDRVLGMLALARGQSLPVALPPPPVGFREGGTILSANTARLLGPPRTNRGVRIMVTLPTEAAGDPALVHDLVAAGMDCARINCAHDDEDHWGAMVENLHRARAELGVDCRILMDLGGPKVRTAALPGVKHVRLRPGDRLSVVTPERAEAVEKDGALRIGCEVPEVFRDVRAEQAIAFDDGAIAGVIEEAGDDELVVRITHAREQGRKLKAEKGINLPESALSLPALTEKDRRDLPFVCAHADVVALSFVQHEEDVVELQSAMEELGDGLGLVLKIETRLGFSNLPRLLLAALRSPAVGVMIARGDLAVECGFERMAEVQEEMLWIAEAAHIPTIWATQVLESLAKKGVRTRAEVTDAAMSGRAECVMLNKGPYLVDAIRTLDDILVRMQAHQAKKESLLRPLQVSESLKV